MNHQRNKWILTAYAIILVLWLSLHPSRALNPLELPKENPSTFNEATKQMSLNIPNRLAPCEKCHSQPQKTSIDLTEPACAECHSSLGEEAVPAIEAYPAPKAVPAALSPMDPSNMIYIPPGEFLMGNGGRATTEGAGNPDEAPLHKVYLEGYSIDQYEVSNAQYKLFVDKTGIRPPRHWKDHTYPPEKEHHPVIYINWFEANAHCHWVGKRLPTEAEWEKAARGTDARSFPWGNQFDPLKANTPQRWLSLNQKGDTMPVGSFEKGQSPYGLYDMAGNVYEWTSSWYKPYPNNRIRNVHYGEKNKIVRGGSWYDCLSYGCGLSSPTFNRSRFAPVIRNKSFGFRCAKS